MQIIKSLNYLTSDFCQEHANTGGCCKTMSSCSEPYDCHMLPLGPILLGLLSPADRLDPTKRLGLVLHGCVEWYVLQCTSIAVVKRRNSYLSRNLVESEFVFSFEIVLLSSVIFVQYIELFSSLSY